MEQSINAVETRRSVFAQVIAQTIISQNKVLVKKATASVTTEMQHEHCEELRDVKQANGVAAVVHVPCQSQSEMSLSSQTPPFLVILFSLCA